MNLTHKIHRELQSFYITHDYQLHNSYVFPWESDFLTCTKSNYVYEIEVKISKSDFNNDKKKVLRDRKTKKHDALLSDDFKKKPNKFYYAFPEGLIPFDLIDKSYGIIECRKDPYIHMRVVRHGRFLHKENLFKQHWFLLQMMKKFYYRNIDLRRAMELRDADIKYNQKRLFDITHY